MKVLYSICIRSHSHRLLYESKEWYVKDGTSNSNNNNNESSNIHNNSNNSEWDKHQEVKHM